MEFNSLFREEAIKHASGSFLGDTRLLPSPRLLPVTATIVICLVLLATGVGMAPYTRSHEIVGEIDTPQAKEILATRIGELTTMNVREGQTVNTGDLLGTVSSNSSYEAVESQLLDERHGHVKLESVIRQRHKSQLGALEARKQELNISIQLAAVDLQLQQSHLDQLQDQHQRFRKLHQQGYLADAALQQRQFELTSASQQQNRLELALHDLQSRRAAIVDDLVLLETRHQEELTELKIRLNLLNRQIASYRQQHQQRLIAPVDGVVTRINKGRGSWVQPGEPLIVISAGSALLSATAYAGSQVAVHVEPGQRLKLRLGDHNTLHDELTGTVMQIPPHPVRFGAYQGSFPVRLALAPHPDDSNRLLPGMQFSTTIVTESKSVFRWILDPMRRRLQS